MKRIRRHLDLQAKISLILVGVILPTFLVVTLAENKLTRPLLEEEVRQIGITNGKTLAAEVATSRLLSLQNPTPAIESRLQDVLISQPNIVRIDVLVKDPASGASRLVASNFEEDATAPQALPPLVDSVTSTFGKDDNGVGQWDIYVPIDTKARDPKKPSRVLGNVHVVISMKLIGQILNTLGKVTAIAAALSVVLLILVLSYFLRKTIMNDRLLRRAESYNLQLTEQLHEAQRQLMNTEKLAVMGQLTASFAHEIGTPLNAIGGHLQLLKEELPDAGTGRLEIVNGQLSKIEAIVKSFLQSTAKPVSQSQLVDVNLLAEKTLGIVRPRADSARVEIRRQFDRQMGPIRVVPLELEQILLNLVNNSLDSIKSKTEARGPSRDRSMALEISTQVVQHEGRQWAAISVYDTGEGISKADLKNVLKPFFTTKRPGEGTGLGLTICQQLARKYDGILDIDSKEGSWTRVTVRIPYQTTV